MDEYPVHLHKFFGRTESTLLRQIIFSAGKHVGADLLLFAAPEIAEVVCGRKNFKTAKSVGRQISREQLGSGSRKMTASTAYPTKSSKQTTRSRLNIIRNICP